MAKKDAKKDKKASVWMLSAEGESTLSDGGNARPSHLKTQMDTLGAKGKTMVIETENEEVLRKAAEYALQNRYDLVSALPEQNLKIQEIQNALSPEKEIAGGELGPSQQQQKLIQQKLEKLAQDKKDLEEYDRCIDYSDDRETRAREWKESDKRHAEIAAREKAYREKGWLPPEPGKQPDVTEKAEKAPKKTRARKSKTAGKDAAVAVDAAQEAGGGQPDATGTGAKKSAKGKGKGQEESAADIADDIMSQQQPMQNPMQQEPSSMFPEKRPAEVLSRRLLIPTAKDHGNRLVITRMGMMAMTPPHVRERDELIANTLLMARERFGEPVRVTGHGMVAGRFFEDAVIKAAIANDIPLEMSSDRGEKAYAKALEKHKESVLSKDIGSLGPSKQREQKKEQSHGGRELAI